MRVVHKIGMTKRWNRHGWTGTPTYCSWYNMRSRVLGRTERKERYAGRGITCDPRWEIFTNFLADMGPRPVGKTLDRRDNNGNYTKQNCRWATPTQQTKNRRPYGRTGVHGVYKTPSKSRYQAIVSWHGKQIHVGYFDDVKSAELAHQRKLQALRKKKVI